MVNYTYAKQRREDIIIGISYEDDLQRAKKIISDLIDSHDKVIPDPEPTVGVSNLGEYSVDIQVRFWVATDDYLDMKYWFLENIKEKFTQAGITIPYPHREVRMCHVNERTNTNSSQND
jgi:small conductance mechanosensitive channel